MKVRLDEWIHGLKYDWNISRQRYYGVPFPLWYCVECGHVVLARQADLPVDPQTDSCPITCCTQCTCGTFVGEPDVMDTWMTSSLTPLINADWGAGGQERMHLYPMTVRVQAYEIIRTWLFYTLVKSHLHTESLPWRNVAISGWGLNEQGRKISKRDLETATNSTGYNRYEPHDTIRKYGADALRFWATGSQLGHDLKYSEKEVRAGRKLVLKLWNAARFCVMSLDGFDLERGPVAFENRTSEDKWIASELQKTIGLVSDGLNCYSYARARAALDTFFWQHFCDDYIEMIKSRFWLPEQYSADERASAQSSMWEALRALVAMYAPFVPFVTEHIYQLVFRPVEGHVSVHTAGWPRSVAEHIVDVPEMRTVHAILRAVRTLRNRANMSQTRSIEGVIIDIDNADEQIAADVRRMTRSIQAVARARTVCFGPAEETCSLSGVRVGVTP
jgi:valyl-tRNA synthetase